MSNTLSQIGTKVGTEFKAHRLRIEALEGANAVITETVQDIVGDMVSGNTENGIAVTYDDTTGKLNLDVNDPVITLTGDVTGSATMTNLGNVTITAVVADDSHNHIIDNIDGLQTALDSKIASTEKGAANGVATLDSTGKVPSNQLPSHVNDVVEATNLASFPATGETGKIYVALDTNKAYRWSGSAYIYITSGAVDSVAGKTGVVTLVKGDVGLGNVDNTSDANKPVSTATQTALNAKQNTITGAATTITSSNLTASMAMVTDASGKVAAHGTVSATELGYLGGVTSAIQTQLNDKAATTHIHAVSDVTGLQTALNGKSDSSHTHTIANVTNLQTVLDGKQSTLVSGTNIKTINGQSLLGSGNIELSTYTLEWSQTTFYITRQASATITNYDSYTTYNVTALLGTVSIVGDTITYTAPAIAGNEVVSINGVAVASFGVTLPQYGVDWNPTTDTYTRTGTAVGTPNSTSYAGAIQVQMKRCVLNANGTVAYYLHPTNSTLKADGSAATIDGSAGNVMVEIPKFYHKYENVGGVHKYSVSPIAEAGYTLHPAFIRGGVEKNFRYYPAYEGHNLGGKLISGSGRVPTVNQTRATFRSYAAANGTGWSLIDWNLLYAVQLLFLTEYATFDTQAMLGNGNDAGGDYTMTTGGSNGIGNGSSPATNDDKWMSYRGIENWYASMWKFIDGVNVQVRVYFVNNNPATFADDVFTGGYVSTGITSAASDGFISNMSSSDKGFIPSAAAGSSSTKVPDYFYQSTGNRIVLFGGEAGDGLYAGGFCLTANIAASAASADFGSGVSY